MSIRAVLLVLGNLMLILAASLLLPLAVALLMDSGRADEMTEVIAFVLTIGIAAVTGVVLRLLFRGAEDNIRVREGFGIVTFAWLVMCLIGMLPYLFSGSITSISDAFFETMSGFTTTGASVLPKVEVLPHGVQFWRCMTQWLGGMGIVVLSVALLPILGVGGYRLLKAEAPGGVVYERDRPRITDAAKALWKLYLAFSVVECLLLWALGMSLYDAVCHTFTTMSTGGFSPHTESVGFFESPAIQWVIILFMFISGVNFALHAHALRGRVGVALRNFEFRLYTAIVVGLVGLGLLTVPAVTSFEPHLRVVVFQVVAIGTTTGYATADFDAWPQIMRLSLVMVMFIGGCMGSTAGGMKVARLAVYAKTPFREAHRLIFPHAVRPARVGNRVVEPQIIANIMAFGMAFIGAFFIGVVAMAASGYDLVTSASAAAAALGNIGPGLGKVGPSSNWGHLPAAVKWIMSLLMLIGRLEVFSVLVLFTPWLWKR